RAGETPGLQQLRVTVIEDLGAWGDPAVIAEARRRFGTFMHDPRAISPNDQSMIFDVVGRYADAAAFNELHTLANQSRDETKKSRLYRALALVRDRKLAAQAADIAIGPEIPPQLTMLRLEMLASMRTQHPKLAWAAFSGHVKTLLSPLGDLAPLVEAQYVPQLFWNSLPLDQMQAWLKARVPAAMGPQIATGMASARFQVAQKAQLVPEARAYLATPASHLPRLRR
ncbi:MAG TPA: ERAP1-like C-terminal domain-containing protein, partial [Steroidobacteraceae bacterium]|nr:ERAP1-like C-terminal domain-containing protein [Steroidobacteraceae bacterium]